jgi:3-oxoacyl-[acyl-carrier-protein] synthase II
MIKGYSEQIAIMRQCYAIANIGSSWPDCWDGLLLGKRIFSYGNEIFSDWPDTPPLAAIAPFPGMDEQPRYELRARTLANLAGQKMKGVVDGFYLRHPQGRLTIIVASSHFDPGPLSTIVDRQYSNPDDSDIPSDSWKGVLAIRLTEAVNAGLQRRLPATNVSAACASSLVALSYAADRISSGLCDGVLLVGIDVLSRVASVGFSNLGAMSARGCIPYDVARDGTTVGEGAVAMLLARRDHVDDSDIYGFVGGTATYCDAAHMVEPNPEGVSKAILAAFEQARLQPKDIRGIFWHGTGTRQNDKTEAAVAQLVFGDKSPSGTSTKGSLGHTMGASSGFNILAACEANRQGLLPHVAGTVNPEHTNLSLVLGHPKSIEPGPMLITALGFGGINAAAVIYPALEP